MEIFSNPLIVNIVFVLLQCISYMDADCLRKEYRSLPEGFNVFLRSGTRPTFNATTLNSETRCALLCMNENFCKLWRFGNGTCQIFHSMKDKVTVKKSSGSAMTTYYEKNEDWQWIKMYSVKKESKFRVAASFLGKGDYESWGPESCTKKFCPDLFRSVLIDVWKELPIKKVRISLIKNNTEVLYLIFNGQGTTSSSWFSMSQVLESPWKDVHKGARNNLFTVDLGGPTMRAFYISQYQGGCPNDHGWLVVTEPGETCPWGQYPTSPQILYSKKDVSTNWKTEYAIADALAVYISF